MRFLLDEGTAVGLAGVLRALGHEADHILELGWRGAPDEEVVRLAADYDALITLDLHRQDAEWVVVNEVMQRFLEQDPSVAGAMANLLPVELVEPVDISNAILWLVSDEARYVTGVTLPVDAGFTIK